MSVRLKNINFAPLSKSGERRIFAGMRMDARKVSVCCMVGQYTDDRKYVTSFDIACYEVDSKMRLKPSAFMNMAQELAYQAATYLGFGYDALREEGKAWVLSRMDCKWLRAPLWREKVRLSTWHKGPSGPFYLRDFTLVSDTGEPLVLCTSSWVILNVAERSLCRTSDVMRMVPEDTVCQDNAIATPAPKVVIPHSAVTSDAGVHRVEYSDIDLLGHTNNAKYVLWAMDCIDCGFLAEHQVRGFSVNFHHETHPGEEVMLKKAESRAPDGGVTGFYVSGDTAEHPSFTVKIEF